MSNIESELVLLRSLSPLHVGSGSEIGLIDLPIQRESHNLYPKIDASSLKGALREVAYHQIESRNNQTQFEKVFGNSPDNKEVSQASAFMISEARILFFPVQSLRNVFTYVTCPYVLNRFINDAKSYGISRDFKIDMNIFEDDHVYVSNSQLLSGNNQLVLKEFAYQAEENEHVKALAEEFAEELNLGVFFSKRCAVVPDDVFSQFVQFSTDISTRINVNPETGTVEEGALFNEENCPADSIFYSLFHYRQSRLAMKNNEKVKTDIELNPIQVKDYIQEVIPPVFQVGGNQTIGRGFISRHTIKEA